MAKTLRLALCHIALLAALGAEGAPTTPFDRTPILDPNGPCFPDACIADCSDLLSPPAGARGFLFVGADGRFYFEDGTRGRFWGINVAKDAVFQPHAIIRDAADAIARAGFNLVRLHHLDDETGLLPASRAGASPRLDVEKLDAVDRWVAELKQRGVYIYIDLLDFRTFRPQEGVPSGEVLGRGAKPYALFNERLIRLQREYARELLFEHQNPYTGLTYAEDSAVCMIELCDENGLFHEESRLADLAAPYKDELLRRWNFWLLSQHGSREALAKHWTEREGARGLGEDEDPRAGSVGFPGITPGCDTSAPRTASRNAFMAGLHRDYFRTMIGDLRSRGLRCPITAVTKPHALADLWSCAQELDFVATNYYYDHPYFRAGSQWRLPAFLSGRNPLTDRTGAAFAPHVASVRVAGKPLVVREWGVCWPNESRAAGMLEAAAYASLQDVDAMILFTLDTRPSTQSLGFFDVRRDPTRWGIAPLCARLYLGRQVKAAEHEITVRHSARDVFSSATALPAALWSAARVARMENAFDDGGTRGRSDVTVLSRIAATAAESAEASVISLWEGTRDDAYPAPASPVERMAFTFGGTLFGAGVSRDMADCAPFATADVRGNPDWRPIGTSEDGRHCLGIRDMRRRNYVFGKLSGDLKLRAVLDALGQLHNLPVGHSCVDRRVFASDTEQLIVDQSAGILWVNSPVCHAVAGRLGGGAVSVGPLTLETASRTATCAWVSLDRLPQARSQRWLLKYVTVARNTDEEIRVHVAKVDNRVLALDKPGGAPVTTCGAPTDTPTTVVLGGRSILSAHMLDGSLELCRWDGRLYLYCDTPGVRVSLPQQGEALSAVVHELDGSRARARRFAQPFEWPEGAAILEVKIASAADG